MLGRCLSMDACAAGFEEVLAPTLFSKRQCQICLAVCLVSRGAVKPADHYVALQGKFKELAGQATACVNTTACLEGQGLHCDGQYVGSALRSC